MRHTLLLLLLGALTGCAIEPSNPIGRACDATHLCPDGLSCIEGGCWKPCDDPRLGSECTNGALGECRRTGSWQCVAGGVVQCNAPAGAPADEVCDGVDNDCDGITDEVSACVSTVAWASSPAFVDGTLEEARFSEPYGLLALPDGDFLVSELNHTIRRVSPEKGTVTLVAGVPGESGSTPGVLGVGRLYNPAGMAVDPATGTVYIADQGTNTIRTLKDGRLETLAGDASEKARLWVDGPAAEARFFSPRDVAFWDGTLYIADSINCRVRALGPDGRVTTVAGNGCGVRRDGRVSEAVFGEVAGITVGPEGTLYVTDRPHHAIRSISLAKDEVRTLAGGTRGDRDGHKLNAMFYSPAGIQAADEGLYVADEGNGRIRLVKYDGTVSTAAGAGIEGLRDGPALEALLTGPVAVSVVGGTVYFVGAEDHRLRKLDPVTGHVLTLAGGRPGLADGSSPLGAVSWPAGITSDPVSGTTYFTDQNNHVVRALRPDGTVFTVAGTGEPGYTDGDADSSRFHRPRGIRYRSDGVLIVADSGNNRIRSIELASGRVATLAGKGSPDECRLSDGPALAGAYLCSPFDVALAPGGEIYFVESRTDTVRVLEDGRVTTVAGRPGRGGVDPRTDGPAMLAVFNSPTGLELGPDGLLYIADTWHNAIRILDLGARQVSTLVGVDTCDMEEGSLTGYPPPGVCLPTSVTFLDGDLYVVSKASGFISRISSGKLTNVMGIKDKWGARDGHSWEALLTLPETLTPAPGGGLFVADFNNGRIRRVVP